jgi:hypothetical protein
MKAKTASLENSTLLDFLWIKNKTISLKDGTQVKIWTVDIVDKQQINILNEILGTNITTKADYKQVMQWLSILEMPFESKILWALGRW